MTGNFSFTISELPHQFAYRISMCSIDEDGNIRHATQIVDKMEVRHYKGTDLLAHCIGECYRELKYMDKKAKLKMDIGYDDQFYCGA